MTAFVSATILYLATMAPGELWGDSGDCQLRVLAGEFDDPRELARAHVTFYAVAIAVHRWLGVDAALSANVVTALAGAVTIANFAVLAGMVGQQRLAIVAATAMMMLSHTLWQLSTGAEVVTFSTCLLTLELILFIRFLRTGSRRMLVLTALVNGLGLATHNMAMLTWPAYTILLVVGRRRLRASAGLVAVVAAVWLIGAMPLLVLFIEQCRQLGSGSAALSSLLFGVYSQEVLNLGITPELVFKQFAFLGLNFPTPLILLALPGWWMCGRRVSRSEWIYLSAGLATFAAFAFRYTVPDQNTFWVHAYLYVILFAAVGIDWLLRRNPGVFSRVLVLLLAVIAPAYYGVVPTIVCDMPFMTRLLPARQVPYRESCRWLLTPWRTGYDGARRYASEVLAVLPEGAVLLAGDTMRRPIEYLHANDGLRPDVRLPYRQNSRPWQTDLSMNEAELKPFVQQGVLFSVSDVYGYSPRWLFDGGYRFEPFGLVYRVLPPV